MSAPPPPGADPVQETVRRLTSAWWLVGLFGVLGIVAGVIVLVWPSISLSSFAVITGIFLLVDGVFEAAGALSRRAENRGMMALLGVLSVIAGLILVRHPFEGVMVLALLLGIWLVALGVARLVAAFEDPDRRAWNAIVAALEIIAGIVIVASPGVGVTTLAIIVGIAFIVRGAAMCVAAWALRAVRPHLAP